MLTTNELSAPARVLRRLVGVMIALALAVGLTGMTSPAARADTSENLTNINWDISDLNGGGASPHQRYWDVIARLHTLSSHDWFRTDLDETQVRDVDRLIQISIHRGGIYQGALYFWPHNLYVAGFYQAGGTHWTFNDGPAAVGRFNRVLGVNASLIPWSSNYNNIPGGSDRQSQQITGPRLDNALQQLSHISGLMASGSGRSLLADSVLMMVQATSEAARFGRIFDNIRGNIRDHGVAQVGVENVNLETNWAALSNWVYRVMNNPGTPAITVGAGVFARTFYTLPQLMQYVSYMDLFSGSRPQP
ncbi:ribosome-inactivating family protein [Kitasatospora sp. NPDC048286]|uniref:ribosome-inactivating family protein n=1 Tax=Kitasatospora sp. NPDC048286 TaxID=3364047 RepID=UPI00370F7C7B